MKHFKRFFLYSSVFFVIFYAFDNISCKSLALEESVEGEIKAIDNRIAELEKMKRSYESKIIYHKNEAARLQFTKDEQATAKKHLQLADENRQIVKKIQSEIDALNKQKQELLNKGA